MASQIKLYRHYKNKLYHFFGTAKHSEDLNDYVVYESLYENELATLWIRPKEMFFESVVFNEKPVSRFTEVLSEIKEITDPDAQLLTLLTQICRAAQIDFNQEEFLIKIKNQKHFLLFCFYIESELAGFRAGFALDEKRYHSFIGAVAPKYSKIGITRALMNEQQNWVKQQGYKTLFFEKELN